MTEATEHRVATHLGIDVAVYDEQIRRYIPNYDEMIQETLAILDATLPAEDAVVADLGTGTGALAGRILDAIPRASVILVDIDPAMLEVAAARVAHHGSRATPHRARFHEAFTDTTGTPRRCDAVVASLALHHVAALADKQALYAQIYAALRPGGVLLLADATVHETGREHDHVYDQWRAGMAHAGIGTVEARALFAQWAREDRYYPLAVELATLAAAGFARPECFWRRGPMTVYGGFRA